MTKLSYMEMIQQALSETQDNARSVVSRQKIHSYMLDKWNIDVVNDGPRKASFKRALETGCSNDFFVQEKQSFRLSTAKWQEVHQSPAKRQPSTSPKAKAAKKETPKKSNATKKVTAAKGEKGTPAPKKKGAKAVQAAA